METVPLVPAVAGTRVGFGCGGLMREPSKSKRQRVLAEAFEQGIRHFDVARMYGLGAVEAELGEFAGGRRDELTIVTKFGIEPSPTSGRLGRLQGPARRLLARYPALRTHVKRRGGALHRPGRYDRVAARESLTKSLSEMRIDYVDVLLLHDPATVDAVNQEEIGGYLEEARSAGHLRAWGVAGEPSPCVELKRSFPQDTILQVHHDVFSPEVLDRELEPLITFGVLGNPIARIEAHLDANPGRREQWSQALGIDCAAPNAIASLLLRDALKANPRGVVLFGTNRPERLRALVRAATSTDADRGQALTMFRERVMAELA
jgi:D-threo-aldose 1-dehydrogenase